MKKELLSIVLVISSLSLSARRGGACPCEVRGGTPERSIPAPTAQKEAPVPSAKRGSYGRLEDFAQVVKRDPNASQKSQLLQAADYVVVDFWAPWCGPCKALTPVIEGIAKEHPHVRFIKVNIDSYKEAANAFGVQSVPTVVFIKKGSQVDKMVGNQGKGAIVTRTKKHFN